MGKRGPLPKPTSLKKLAGNPGKRALPKGEPNPRGNLSEPPAWMSKDQKADWNYALANAPRGLLRKLDASVLEMWVVAHDLHGKAARALNRQGAVVTIDGVRKKSPWIMVLKDQATTLAKAINLLGFAPAARPRLATGIATSNEDETLVGALDAAAVDEDVDAYLARKPSRLN